MVDRRSLRLVALLLVLLLATPLASALAWDEKAWKAASADKKAVVVRASEEQVIYDGGTTSATYSLTNWVGSTMDVVVLRKATATSFYTEVSRLQPGESVDVAGFAIKVKGTAAEQTQVAGVFYGRT